MQIYYDETLIEIYFGVNMSGKMTFQYELDPSDYGTISIHTGKFWSVIYGKVGDSDEVTVRWK